MHAKKFIGALAATAGAAFGQTERGLVPPPVLTPVIEFTGFSTTPVTPGQLVDVTLTIENTGLVTSLNTEVQIATTLEVVGSNPINLGAVPGGSLRNVTFQVRADCGEGGLGWIFADLTSNAGDEDDTVIVLPAASATQLNLGVVHNSEAPEQAFDIPIFSWDWMITAMDPGASGHNLVGGNADCDGAWVGSSQPGSAIEFVAVNGEIHPGIVPQATVVGGDSDEMFRIQTDSAYDLVPGAQHDFAMSATDIFQAYEPWVNGTGRFRFTATTNWGGTNVVLYYMEAGREFGTPATSDRVINDVFPVDYSPETFDFNINTLASKPLIVMMNSNHNAGNFSVTLEQICPCEYTGDYDVTIADLLAYLDFWFESSDEAELTGNGTVDVADLLEFLSCWFVASSIGCV